MMTLEQIRNVEFTRGRGYRAEEVDDFIDDCVATLEKYRQEAEEANQKMKQLAEKLVEYRNEEDSIRAALLNAQRAGDSVLREAEEKAKTLVQEAEQAVQNIHREAQKSIEAEKKELARVQQEVAHFKQQMLTKYKEHLALINVLPEAEEKPAETEEAGEQFQETVTVSPSEEMPEAAPADTSEQQALSRFADLKFGEDYRIEDNADADEERGRGFFRKKK